MQTSDTRDLPNRLDEVLEENRKLQGLVDTFSQLNSSLDLATVLKNTLTTATQLMQAEIGSIALIDKEHQQLKFVESTDKNFATLKQIVVPLGEGISGDVALTGKTVRVEDVHQDKRFYGKIDDKLGSTTQSYLCIPLIVHDDIIGTAQLMNRKDGKSFTEADVKLLEGFGRQAALAIHNARMHEVMLAQKSMEKELEVCSQIQQKIFPEAAPTIPGYEALGVSVPCRQVGGDYFTYVARPDGSFDLFIADVSGKGLSASLMVSELHTGLQLLSLTDGNLQESIQILNDHLVDSLILGKFITLFAIRLRANTDEIEYVLAGHPSPFIIGPTRTFSLEITGPVLGVPQTPPVKMGSFKMESGDVLASFTDGYSEAQDANFQLFNEEPIARIIEEHRELPLEEIRNRLDNDINIFTGGAPATDDLTLLLLRKF